MEPYVDRPQPSPGWLLLIGVVAATLLGMLVIVDSGAFVTFVLDGDTWFLQLAWALFLMAISVCLGAYAYFVFRRGFRAWNDTEYRISAALLSLRSGQLRDDDIFLEAIAEIRLVRHVFGVRNWRAPYQGYVNRIGPGVLLTLASPQEFDNSPMPRSFRRLYLTPSNPEQFIAALQARIAATGSAGT